MHILGDHVFIKVDINVKLSGLCNAVVVYSVEVVKACSHIHTLCTLWHRRCIFI